MRQMFHRTAVVGAAVLLVLGVGCFVPGYRGIHVEPYPMLAHGALFWRRSAANPVWRCSAAKNPPSQEAALGANSVVVAVESI